MSLSTGGNSSTAMVITDDFFFAWGADAAATDAREPAIVAPTTSAISIRLLMLMVFADIGGPQPRRRF